jgi:hypothetical protein
MDRVIGKWIIRVQDAMPDALRNSNDWKDLLIEACGTGQSATGEKAKLEIILEWMWRCLGIPQSIADKYEFGAEWAAMLTAKSTEAVNAVVTRANAAALDGWLDAAAETAIAAATNAITATKLVTKIVDDVIVVDDETITDAVYAAVDTVASVIDAVADDFEDDFERVVAIRKAWRSIDPCGLLETMIDSTGALKKDA